MAQNFEEIARQAEQFGQWDSRLKLEIPFFASILHRYGARRACDAGCGAGRHTIALAQMGFEMAGIDPNAEYIGAARERSVAEGVQVEFHQADFDGIASISDQKFDAILSLGNSLSLVESYEKLRGTLKTFSSALVEGGLLIVQTPNFDRFREPEHRWKILPAQGPHELALKHFSPWGKEHFAVEFLTVRFDPEKGWGHEIKRSRILNLTPGKLEPLLAGQFESREKFGHADGREFSSESPDCILCAIKNPMPAMRGFLQGFDPHFERDEEDRV